MKLTFDDALALSGQEFALLRNRAINLDLFDRAVRLMQAQQWRCDTSKGVTSNKDGVQAAFVGYDWSADYEKAPHHVFYDYFRGHLLNKYSRLVRGLEE